MKDTVTITGIEYEEYEKLKTYKKFVTDNFAEIKATILQLKVLSEAFGCSAVSKNDIRDLMSDNIIDLFKAANEFDKFISTYIDFTIKK